MEAVRLIAKSHWHKDKRRFVSVAFRNSSGNSGISVFDRECAEKRSGSICQHVNRYYTPPADHTAVFWCFNTSLLPDGVQLIQSDSSSGDDCHYNIIGLSNHNASAFFKNYSSTLALFTICDDGQERILTAQDLDD